MSEANSQLDTPSIAPPQPPFDDTSADVILRASDGMEFRLRRAVLSLASPIFEHMFSLPQPEPEQQLPVIAVSESGLLLDRMLRFWYPGAQPAADTLDGLRDVLAVLIFKYDMHFLAVAGQAALQRHIESDPLAVFAIACSLEWRQLAISAAKASLKLPLRVFSTGASAGLRHVTGEAYHNLLHYHYLCGEAAHAVTADFSWLVDPGNWAWINCRHHEGRSGFAWSSTGKRDVRAWFADFAAEWGEALRATPAITGNEAPIIYRALSRSAFCGECRDWAFQQLPCFVSSEMIPKIKEEIGKVQIKLTF
ncbi:hypothetical protein C8F01DRAFT_773901 [Mycena amicta]|nr:hypothetical protein C8F01DRAFT_773901 [Mycena amicta]